MMDGERKLLITSALQSRRCKSRGGAAVGEVLLEAKRIHSNFDLAREIDGARRSGDWQLACSLVLDGALHRMKGEGARLRAAGKKSLESDDMDRIISDESGRLCGILIEIYQKGGCGKSLQDWKKFAGETRDMIAAGLTEVLFEEGGERISFVRLNPEELSHIGALWLIAEYRAEVEVGRLEANEKAVERLRRAPIS
jgi:hypothetical protein